MQQISNKANIVNKSGCRSVVMETRSSKELNDARGLI